MCEKEDVCESKHTGSSSLVDGALNFLLSLEADRIGLGTAGRKGSSDTFMLEELIRTGCTLE